MSPPPLHLIPQIFNSLVVAEVAEGSAAAVVGSVAAARFAGVGSPAAAAVAVALHTGATQGAALLRIAVMGTAVEACATAADTVTVDGMPEGTDATGTDDTAGALLLSARRRPARTTTIMAAIMTATGVGSARANIRIELSKFQAKADKTAFAGNDRDFSATL
jgi:hypothetical protein